MSHSRRGFTLVELLVVAGIMAVLFSLIVAGGRAKPTALRAAQDFASMLLAAQSRALGKPQGAAIMIEADPGTTRFGSVIHEADTLPPIVIPLSASDYGRHKDFPDLVTVPNFSAGNATLLQDCYKMRFQRRYGLAGSTDSTCTVVSPWLGLRARTLGQPSRYNSPPPPTGSVGVPVRRESAGQGVLNTSFVPPGTFSATPPGSNIPVNPYLPPYDPSKTYYEAVVIRHPTVGLNSTRIAPNLAIDLLFSGVGGNLTASHGYGTFNGTSGVGMSPLAIVFDQTGRVSDVLQQVKTRDLDALPHDINATDVRSPPNPPPDNRAHLDINFPSIEHPEWRDPAATAPLVPNEIIYFLFVDRSAIAANQSLASESAAWVALDPFTGRISVSSNVPDATDIGAARANARSAVAFGK